ncbi:hypothetical protein TNCV_4962841 [Trichonephila clavipes]|nr:hypothetical protein TNCV_4962841 [Trichonephila clavipes]
MYLEMRTDKIYVGEWVFINVALEPTLRLLVMVFVTLSRGQVTRMTPQLAHSLLISTTDEQVDFEPRKI